MKRTVTAVEFGTSKVVALIGEIATGSQGDMIGYGIASYDGYTQDGWNASDSEIDRAVLQALKGAEQMAKRKADAIFVGVPSAYLTIASGEAQLPITSMGKKVSMDEVDKVIDLAMANAQPQGEVLHTSPAWFKVDDVQTMEPADQKGDQISCSAFAVVADAAFTAQMRGRFEGLGHSIEAFVSPSLGEALMVIPPQERDRVAVLVDCGYLSTQVMVVQGDALCYLDTIWDGAGYLTAQLAEALEVTMALADQIKRQVILSPDTQSAIEVISPEGERILFTNELAFHAIEPSLEELASAIKQSIQRCTLPLPPKVPCYLTGGGLAAMRGAREYLGARIGYTLKACTAHPSILTGANYTSSVGLMELVFEQSSLSTPQQAGLMNKLKTLFKK